MLENKRLIYGILAVFVLAIVGIGLFVLNRPIPGTQSPEITPMACENNLDCPAKMECENPFCVDVGCIEEGKTLPSPSINPKNREHMATQCCQGLEAIAYSGDYDENCNPTFLRGGPAGVCSKCGNGICEEWETNCNCPEDCPEEECAEAGEEISPKEYTQGVRCCSGLKKIHTARYFHTCDTPGEHACDENGCSIPPPTSDEAPWWQCTPCGNGICESEYGENRCNCPEDCK